MKRLFYLFSIIFGAFSAWAQGSGVISFSNVNTTDDRRIWTYEGGALVRASGTSYRIALYWGQPGTPENALTQIGAPASFAPFGGGQFIGGNRTVTPVAVDGGVVTVQARGWLLIPGVADSYEAVLASGLGCAAKGPVFEHDTARPGDPTDPPYSIGTDPNWRGFIICIPEPSTIALAVCGGALLILLSRSQKRKRS